MGQIRGLALQSLEVNRSTQACMHQAILQQSDNIQTNIRLHKSANTLLPPSMLKAICPARDPKNAKLSKEN